MSDSPLDHRPPSRSIGAARVAIGFLAGVLIWALNEAGDQKVWPATVPPLFGALIMVAVFVPFVLVGGLGALRARTLALWAAGSAAVLAALGAHDLARRFESLNDPWVSPQLMIFGAAGLFIAHHLVEGADAERKVIATFPRYFEIAWKHGVQLALSAAFVGVFWLILFLGGAMFDLIGIKAVGQLLQTAWFAIPATATMFAAAVHLTDVRAGLIRGIRTVALTLLAWLLPILVVLATAFLLALPFTGLDALWGTRSGAAILLSAMAVLIVLTNAAYQDGEPDSPVPPVLRWSGKLAGVLLAPMVALAAYALWLRIGQYGLTPDRIVAVACVVAGLVYAVGYFIAAVRPGRWMRRLEVTNIIAAFVSLALLLAIFSPLADPARLSVNNQMARLESGTVKPEKLDYQFLRFDSGRYGREALVTLKARGGEVGKRAAAALAETERRGDAPDAVLLDAARVPVIWPAGRTLPDDFFVQQWARDQQRSCTLGPDECQTALLDLTRDGVEEVVIINRQRAWIHGRVDGRWRLLGEAALWRPGRDNDQALIEAIRKGGISAGAPALDDLIIDGERYFVTPDGSPPVAIAVPPAPPPAK
ncbi:MAG: DUF4153 domain-containing protein [Caulobacter sp.]|nr:DUF4153 domain-containing protein [Caulobacter sp.]